jgi:N-acetyl-anhydromuramyl-L-alanine amidase AmpD
MNININTANLKFRSILKKRKATNLIVLHHAEASVCTVDRIHSWHLDNGWAGIGYHFLVRKDGSIYQGRPIDTEGAHCLGFNEASIGICAEGNFETETMSEAQKNAIIDLLKHIEGIYPACTIVGHREKNATSCPGKNYPLEEIKKGEVNINIETAIKKLVEKGIIKSPDYWLQNAKAGGTCKGEYVEALIKAVVKKI